MLMYGAGKLNCIEFRERAATYCIRTYGRIGTVVETGEYPDIDPPIPPSADELANDKFGFLKFGHEQRIKNFLDNIERDNRAKPKIYATLIGRCSHESRERFKMEDNYEDMHRDKSPKRLIGMVEATHAKAETGFKLKDKHTARTEYYKLVQESSMTLVQFKRVYGEALKQLEASVPAAERPSDQDQAIDFIKKLDVNRYGGLQSTLDNNAAMKLGRYPEDLQKAYSLASKYKDIGTIGNGGVPTTATAFVMESNEKQSKPKPTKTKQDKPSTGATGTDRKSDSEEGVPRFPCCICKKPDHFAFKCPLLAKVHSMLEEEGGTEGMATSLVAFADPDYEGDPYGAVF